MSDGGWGGSCGGSEGGYGGYGGDGGYGGNSGCAIPLIVQEAIDAAGANCDMSAGSGVSQSAIMQVLYQDEKGAGIGNCQVGSTLSIPRSATTKTATVSDGTATSLTNSTVVDLGNNGGGVDSISDTGGSNDVFVVGTDFGDTITINGSIGDDSANNHNTLIAGSGAGGDTLCVSAGSNNSLTDGSGGGDHLSVGAGETSGITSNYNLLQTSDTASNAADILTVGQGTHNSVISGNANSDQLSVGDESGAGPSSNNLLEAGNGTGDVESVGFNFASSQPAILPDTPPQAPAGTGAITTVSPSTATSAGSYLTSNGNVLIAGSGNQDIQVVGNGDHNFLLEGSGSQDSQFINSGSYDVFVQGNGNYDAMNLGSADPNLTAPGTDGTGYDTFSVGYGTGDSINVGTADDNSFYMGDGNGDTISWGTSNGSLVSMGDGSSDTVIAGSGGGGVTGGSGNEITLGDGYNDSVTIQTGSGNCVTLGDGNDDYVSVISGNQETLSIGNGNYGLVSLGSDISPTTGAPTPGDSLLQCGNGNFDVVANQLASFVTPYSGAAGSPPPVIAMEFNSGSGSGEVLESGSGSGDFLVGGATQALGEVGDTMVAGTGVGDASFNGTAWSGIWGDTLTGNGGVYVAPAPSGTGTVSTGGDTYVLNCGGGDLVQDFSYQLQGSLIVNFAGTSLAQSGFATSGGQGGDCDDDNSSCGSNNNNGGNNNYGSNCGDNNNSYGGDCGGNNNNSCGGDNDSGCGTQGSTFTAQNAIDVTDISASDASVGLSGTSFSQTAGATETMAQWGDVTLGTSYGSLDGAATTQLSVFDSQSDAGFSLTLFGNYSAAGFLLNTDNGIVNDEASYESGGTFTPTNPSAGVVAGTSIDPAGLLITYSGSTSSSCGGSNNSGCGGDDNCGGNSNPCNTGGSSNCGGSSGGSSNCGGSSYGGDCGSGSNIGSCGSGYENSCISSPGCG